MSQPNEKPSFLWVFFTVIWGHIAISLGICRFSTFGRLCWLNILPGAPLPLPTEYAVMPHLHISMAFLILLAYIIIWMVNYHRKAKSLIPITILLAVFDFLWLLFILYAVTLPCRRITWDISG